jgi:hypothetical protein
MESQIIFTDIPIITAKYKLMEYGISILDMPGEL